LRFVEVCHIITGMQLPDSFRFAQALLRNPATVGAIAPSGRQLAQAMMRDVCVNDDEIIVEFGPGTGALTRAIAPAIHQPHQYIGIERDAQFVRRLHELFPQLSFVHGSAEDAAAILADRHAGSVKAIICGLPFTTLSSRVQDRVIEAVDHLLGPGSVFRTFQYAHSFVLPSATRFRQRMNRVLGPQKRRRVVMGNVPPAYVLTWERLPVTVNAL
jgi:phospholipid N-methyltransferase